MRAPRLLPLLPAALLAAAPCTARPAPPAAEATGIYLGLRAGLGRPWGDLSATAGPVSGVVAAKVPAWIELGYQFARRVRAGLYLELAPAWLARAACPEGLRCEGSDVRLGLELQLLLAPGAPISPWLGLAGGVEILTDTTRVAGSRLDRRWAGPELPILSAGVDVAAGAALTIGPFVSASAAVFTGVSDAVSGSGGVTEGVGGRALHGWVQAGLRATARL
ncbi:MAG TPA: hypothetical protein VFP50_13495 [Anaeromyxobacteraceae bacterium]|nr:hypothetical protein [Anaeromyxobacteraceae bacterium]